MATQPIGSFSGLASGIQWRDMVDQIIAMEETRRLRPVTDRVTLQNSRRSAWDSYSGLLSKFNTAIRGIRDASAFATFKTSVGNSPSTSATLLTATTSETANPGTHKVEVLALARNEKLSGAVYSSSTNALSLTGEFVVNGRRIAVEATDSLSSLRDKINAVNGGSTPTGVTASILSTGTDQHRIVLTSDHTGAAGIDLTDGATGPLVQLGLLDGTTSVNSTADGGSQSHRLSSATTAIATVLGVSVTPPTTIKVGGKTISVDLSVDSISSIVNKITAAGGTAETVSETVGGITTYRLKAAGTAEVDPSATSTADSRRALEILGLLTGGRSAVAQKVATQNILTDSVGATATTATLLTDLGHGGAAGGVQVGDTFTIAGKRGDGTSISMTYTVGSGDTVQSLLDRLNSVTDGFGSGSRTATASLVNGKISVTDGTAGDSQLALSIVANNEGGGTLNFGLSATETVGRQREVTSGTDAQIKLDGVTIFRASNQISDALAGVTLSLQQAEVGTTVDLSISRDLDRIVTSMNGLASAYNNLVSFVDKQRTPRAPLYGDGTLRSVMSSIRNTLLTEVEGLSSTTYNRAAIAGVALDKNGQLQVDATALKDALTTNFADVKALFSTAGTPSDGEVAYITGTSATQVGSYAIDITTVAAKASQTGAGFSGTYVDDGTADTLSVTDVYSGRTATITLSNGDTVANIVTRLNDAFGTDKLHLEASASGNELKIDSTEYGSAAGFTIAYTAGGTDNTGSLGLAAGTYTGTDLAGTIGGVAATGRGQVLTGATGEVTEGLSIRYTGSAVRAAGTIKYSLGVAGMLERTLDPIVRVGDGTVALQLENIDASVETLNLRADSIQQQLDLRYESLVKQFTRMEEALSKLQAQSAWLGTQLQALSSKQQ